MGEYKSDTKAGLRETPDYELEIIYTERYSVDVRESLSEVLANIIMTIDSCKPRFGVTYVTSELSDESYLSVLRCTVGISCGLSGSRAVYYLTEMIKSIYFIYQNRGRNIDVRLCNTVTERSVSLMKTDSNEKYVHSSDIAAVKWAYLNGDDGDVTVDMSVAEKAGMFCRLLGMAEYYRTTPRRLHSNGVSDTFSATLYGVWNTVLYAHVNVPNITYTYIKKKEEYADAIHPTIKDSQKKYEYAVCFVHGISPQNLAEKWIVALFIGANSISGTIAMHADMIESCGGPDENAERLAEITGLPKTELVRYVRQAQMRALKTEYKWNIYQI